MLSQNVYPCSADTHTHTIEALRITYTILGAPYYNYGNGPQNPILIVLDTDRDRAENCRASEFGC